VEVGRSTEFTIEGQRFPRSVVKRRPRSHVGGKTRKKKGFIGREAAPHSGWIAFVCRSSSFHPSFSFPLHGDMDSHGTLRARTHTMQRRHTYACAHPRIRTKAEEPPLPRVPTCFRPQAAVITAQSRVVDQEDATRRKRTNERTNERTSDAAMQRCSELPLPSSSSCTKRSPPATCLQMCVILPEAMGNVGRDLEVEEHADSWRFFSLREYIQISSCLSLDSLSFASRLFFFFLHSKSIEFVKRQCIFYCIYIYYYCYYCLYCYCTVREDKNTEYKSLYKSIEKTKICRK